MNWVNIGKRIRKQREYLGYTRESLAEKLDITPKFCSDIELGLKGMSVATVCRIAKKLNLSVDYILFGNEDSDINPTIKELLKTCPVNKLPYLEQIIKQFILSQNNNNTQ